MHTAYINQYLLGLSGVNKESSGPGQPAAPWKREAMTMTLSLPRYKLQAPGFQNSAALWVNQKAALFRPTCDLPATATHSTVFTEKSKLADF